MKPGEPPKLWAAPPIGAPWPAVKHFLNNALISDPLTIVVTDGSIQKILRSGRVYEFASLRTSRARESLKALRQVDLWPQDALAWIKSLGFENVRCVDRFVRSPTIAYARIEIAGRRAGAERVKRDLFAEILAGEPDLSTI